MSNVLFTYYEVNGNKDQTEGRGGYVTKRTYTTEELAVKFAKSKEGQSTCGVMGYGYGEVVAVNVLDGGANDGQLVIKRTKIWGYRKDWNDAWGHGYIDQRDAPVNDPDYKEYMRLKAKFESKP